MSVVGGVLASEALRHWLGMTLANVCIVGGVLAAPLVSLAGWIGMALPAHAPLHVASPMLFTSALIWLALAIIGAHLQHAPTATAPSHRPSSPQKEQRKG
jgi:hypothetical protein